MQWLKKQQKGHSISLLTTLFVVAFLSIFSMCCSFSNSSIERVNHHSHADPVANHEILLCADSLPSQSPCHVEEVQEIAVLPQIRDEEVDENTTLESNTNDLFATRLHLHNPPDQKKILSNFKRILKRHQSKLLITQLPRSHLG